MSRVDALTHSLVGKKVLMAVTGAILVGFLAGHVYGNLKIFQGPDHFNAYAEGLRTLGAPLFGRSHLLWIARAVLLASVAGHLWAAYAVTRASWHARPAPYKVLQLVETTYAARTMRWGGLLILAFIIYHLLDFTFGRVNPGFVPGDAYRNVVASFSVPAVAVFYVIAMVALGLHLYHGLWSACQTLGLNHPRYNHLRRGAAGALTVLIVAGFLAIPLAVLAGVVR
jgi:succinate dehydrogenase / fumarate reductase cytochrome b subunit